MFPISPETIVLDDDIYYSVNKSFFHDIGLQLRVADEQEQPGTSAAVPMALESRVKCKHCNASLKLKDMRKHIGRHILKSTFKMPHTVKTCDFCGCSDCDNELVESSRSGRKYFIILEVITVVSMSLRLDSQ